MAEPRRESHLRVLEGGKERRSSWSDVYETLAGVEDLLGGGASDLEDPVAEEQAYRPSQNLPAPSGNEPDEWPAVDGTERIEQLLRQRAYFFGLKGGKRKEMFGRTGSLTRLIQAMVKEMIATVRQRGVERAEELNRTMKSSGTRSRAEAAKADACDRRIAELDARIDEVNTKIRAVDDQYDELTPGQRSGRSMGKEAAAAAGLVDTTAFILTLNGIGGALWLRVAVATTVALAIHMAIVVAGRTLAGMWITGQGSPERFRLPFIVLTFGSLCTLLALTLSSAGELRGEALANLDNGLPTDPRFLVWVGLTAAFGATMALGWWHYSREGDRLNKRRRKLEERRARLVRERAEHLEAAVRARKRAFESVTEAQSARCDLDLVPARTERLVAKQMAAGEALLAVAMQAYAEGRQEKREAQEGRRKPPVTIDPETEQEVNEIIGRD